MSQKWDPHSESQEKLMQKVFYHYARHKSRVEVLDKVIAKLYLLDLDPLLLVIKPLYPGLGRPSLN